MKAFRIIFFSTVILSVLFLSCKKPAPAPLVGNWLRSSDLNGNSRSGSVSFTIGNKAYVGTGFDGRYKLADFWQFDPVQEAWTYMKPFPGLPRMNAIGFATPTMGYIGLGLVTTANIDSAVSDFYAYNPATNSWHQSWSKILKIDTIKNVIDTTWVDSIPTPFGGGARYGAVGFSLNGYGYVTCGCNMNQNYLKDLWQLDPSTNTWTQKTSLGGLKRNFPVAFVINGYAYVVTGVDNGLYCDDMWKYNSTNDTWTEMREIANVTNYTFDDNYKNIIRSNACAVVINGIAFLSCGINQSGYRSETWQYDPTYDQWTQKTSFEGAARTDAVGITVNDGTNDRGFIGTGTSVKVKYDDLWELQPNAGYNPNEVIY